MKNSVLFVICIVLYGCAASLARPDEAGVRDWVSGLSSETYDDRKAALLQLEKSRAEIISQLTDMVTQPVKDWEPFFDNSTSRNMAIYLLGVYRADSAIPVLVKYLAPSPSHSGGAENPMTPVPAAVALRRIGPTATPALLQALRTTTNTMVAMECTRLLVEIEPPHRGRALIEDAIESADVPRKAAIELMLRNLRTHDLDRSPGSE